MTASEATKAPCRRCLVLTNHSVCATRVSITTDEVPGYGQVELRDNYEMLECLGCGTVCLREIKWWSEEPDDAVIIYYPPPVARRIPAWYSRLPLELGRLLHEIYSALHADSRCLVLMGARAALDMVLVASVGDVGSFKEKLKGLEESGFIGAKNRDCLEAALDAGSAAAHRGYLPEPVDLNRVMDIIENLIQATHVLGHDAVELRKRTPQRQKPIRP